MKKPIQIIRSVTDDVIYLPNFSHPHDAITNLSDAQNFMENLCENGDEGDLVTQCLALAMEDEFLRPTVVVDVQGFMMLQKLKVVWKRTKHICRGRVIFKVVAIVVLAMVPVTATKV